MDLMRRLTECERDELRREIQELRHSTRYTTELRQNRGRELILLARG
jgi:hypothetical protein